YFQDGDTLYICGGYGQAANGKWKTFDVISRINLPNFIEGVIRGRFSTGSVSFAVTPLVRSTGGGVTRLNDGYFYLVMGHSFMGSYTAFEGHQEHDTAEASQTYLNEIRKLSIQTKPDG